MSAIYPQDPSFLFELSLRESIDDESQHGSTDLGPTDSLPPDILELEYERFFGSSPLTSPCTSRCSSPSPSRSASPNHVRHSATFATPPPLAHTTQPARKPQNSKQRRNKKRGHENRDRGRKERRDDCREDPYSVRIAIAEKYLLKARPTKTPYSADRIPTASSGYVALPDEVGGIHKLKELVDVMGFKIEAWDGRTPRPITDSSSRIIAVLAGTPEAIDWEAVHQGAAEAIRQCGSDCRFPKKAIKHRRGNFPALSWGISHGGGRKHPGNLYHGDQNTDALSALCGNGNISRIAGNANAAFATWAPKLYTYYEKHLEELLVHDSSLRRNFPNSIWASFAVNFGPKTICRRHRDFSNLPFGWCSVTALGDFDPKKGGHLVLWNLGLIVEFPPGSTILLPSAAIAHSNVPIGKHERRYSFTQYSAGGLFRWVDQGFQSTGDYEAKQTAEGAEEDLKMREERCKLGLSLFSTLSSMSADQTWRNRLI